MVTDVTPGRLGIPLCCLGGRSLAPVIMRTGVACRTKGNKILLGIISGLALECSVMNFKVGHGSARLASPAVAAQHLIAELLVEQRV